MALVYGAGIAGSAPVFDTSDVKFGDIMVAFGATRNGSITGPDGGGWTTLYKVDQATSEWHAVYIKVASGQGATMTFSMSTWASAGLCVFRGNIDSWTTAHVGRWNYGVGSVAAKVGVGIHIGMGSAFGAVGDDTAIDDMEKFAYVNTADEFVKGWWRPVVHDGYFGNHWNPKNDWAYTSEHSINLYAA